MGRKRKTPEEVQLSKKRKVEQNRSYRQRDRNSSTASNGNACSNRPSNSVLSLIEDNPDLAVSNITQANNLVLSNSNSEQTPSSSNSLNSLNIINNINLDATGIVTNRIELNDQNLNISNLRSLKLDHCYYKKVNKKETKKSSVPLQFKPLNEFSEHYIGPMNVLCKYCNAIHFAVEIVDNKENRSVTQQVADGDENNAKKYSFNDCCSHGNVELNDMPDIPADLKMLFEGQHPKSKEFFEKIRSYNCSVSFASFNANLVQFQGRRAPYCFKIHGQIYYQINTTLNPIVNEKPSYGQLFLIDQNEALNCRLQSNFNLDSEILFLIDNIIRNHNTFAQSYQMMGDEISAQQQRIGEKNDVVKLPELELRFSLKPGLDRRRYNLQRSNEVAVIFSTSADGDIPDSYVVIRNKSSKELQRVSTMDPNVEPWVYPLFYPFGTQGWHANIKHKSDTHRVTRSEYFKYRLAVRHTEDQFNVFIHGRRLFQQWLVDSYVKVEKDRIAWCKSQQTKLRIESYQGLTDYLKNKNNINSDARLGKIFILPSTFIGSPRNMMQNYQDAMAIARKFGVPDLFITMTCNPNWIEITENLLPGQRPADRPDICARVFHLKKEHLIDVVIKQKLFGEIDAWIYVIEFQKRGLPHVHLLVTLKNNCKLSTVKQINECISAEIPDPKENQELHKIIMRNNIHGPCDERCLVNGKCSKNFPKAFQNETTLDENSYANLQRRDTGETYMRPGGYEVDNRYVVPYAPKLSLILNCHINVEVVASIRSVKYLYKYFYKGHDAAAVIIGNEDGEKLINIDEPADFVNSRYVGPAEAYWRIQGKKMQDKSHAVTRLPVHLPNQQTIVLDESIENRSSEEYAVKLASALNQTTMLLDYFNLNERDEKARSISYVNIPNLYVFKKVRLDGTNMKQWVSRQGHFNTIGRMYSVSPTNLELYHLRLLLLHKNGATSFENLRTVNDEIHPTFTAACLALGLIEDDEEWSRALKEAAFWKMPNSLRILFVNILLNCQPLKPEELWEKFQIQLSEDFIRRFGEVSGLKKSYLQVDKMLNAVGKSIADFPSMVQISEELFENDVDINESTNNNLQLGSELYKTLNRKQKYIIDTIISSLKHFDNESSSKCFYIDGPGGSGKTHVYKTLYYLLLNKKKRVVTMAFTGIAAILLPGGKTVHKILGLPVPLFSDSSSSIKPQSMEGRLLIETDVFIWDETPMAPRYALEIMDHTLRDFLKTDLPFGGKTIILGGDFRQLLPIKVGGTRDEVINLSIKFSNLWQSVTKFQLTENMRVLAGEQEFSKFLISLGDGKLNDKDGNIMIPSLCVIPTISQLIAVIFGNLLSKKKYKEASKLAILSALNVDVDKINQEVLNLLDNETEKIYSGIDSSENCDNDNMSEVLLPEYLNSLNPPSLPPYELRLRKFAVVMLIRNINIHAGLCNGTRLMILDMSNHSLKCEILTGDKAGDVVFLNRITLYCEREYPFTFKRRQFPIKLAFAMTINKSQGQTFEKIGINLCNDVFSHGQLYVAFSRVRSWNTVKVCVGENCNDEVKVKNIVYNELYT